MEVSDKQWIKGDLLGKGAMACVYNLQNVATKQMYAGKFASGVTQQTLMSHGDALLQEIRLQKGLSHNNIAKIFHDFWTTNCHGSKETLVEEDHKNGRCICIVLELCTNKSLYEVQKVRDYLTEDEVRFYMSGLTKALIYLKSKNIIHRDVKLANILLDKDLNPKLSDFGLATFNNEVARSKGKLMGTPLYMASEMVAKINYSFEIDAWALGVCTFLLLTGVFPFEAKTLKDLHPKILYLDPYFPVRPEISKSAVSFIEDLLNKDPYDRTAIENVFDQDFFTIHKTPTELPISAKLVEPGPLIQYSPTTLKGKFERDRVMCQRKSKVEFYMFLAQKYPNDQPPSMNDYNKIYEEICHSQSPKK